MITKQLHSLQHPLVKEIVQLRKNKNFRNEKKQVLVVGKKIVAEIAKQKRIITLITSSCLYNDIKADTILHVSDQIMKKITNLQSPEDIAAIVDMPTLENIPTKKPLLVLDQISDPGNLGTLIRSALSLNWQGVILTPNTVDPFNDKAIRASKGACFFLPIFFLDEEKILEISNANFYVADLNGKNIDEIKPDKNAVLILSNESHGTSTWAKKINNTITIPMNNNVDSLNVAICGSIIMHHMRG
jgi:RNA methyltransferase, TrmH family